MPKRDKRIEFWDDERDIGNSLIITLHYGWRFDEDGNHVAGFDTVKEVNQAMREIELCYCDICKEINKPHETEIK